MRRLAISNSGGRTSAYMTHFLLGLPTDLTMVVLFANTGCEHEETLKFIDKCDKYLKFQTVWLEAVVTHGERVGIRHKVVDYMTASRNGEPFEEYIKKYGIPNRANPQCTSRLKTEVMESYLKSIGWVRGKRLNYTTAIGIRADEIDRMSPNADAAGFIYPLVTHGITKAKVINFWKGQPFDLQLPGEHYGNCQWCWKKSFRKLATLMKEDPRTFDFPARMEASYGTTKAVNSNGRRNFFRGDKSCTDIAALSRERFDPYSDDRQQTLDEILDVGGGCSDSCEIEP